MKKNLLIILALFIFLSCNESITDSPNADGVAGLEIIVASSTGLHVYGTDYIAKTVENRVVGFLDDLTCK